MIPALPVGVLVGGAVLANSLATLLLRQAVQTPLSVLNAFPFLPLPTLAFGGAALSFYMAAFVFYGLALQRLPVGLAYLLITSLTQTVLLVYGLSVLREKMDSVMGLGIILTMVGLGLIASHMGR